MPNEEVYESSETVDPGEIMVATEESTSRIIIADISRDGAWIAAEQSVSVIPSEFR